MLQALDALEGSEPGAMTNGLTLLQRMRPASEMDQQRDPPLFSRELLLARDAGFPLRELRVDGGASGDNLVMQFQADILGVDVVRPSITETTALGAAYLAGLQAGFWSDLDALERLWHEDRRFTPSIAS